MTPFEIGFITGMQKSAATKGDPEWRKLHPTWQEAARSPHKGRTGHSDALEDLSASANKKPVVEKARFVEGAQRRAKNDTSGHASRVEAQKARDARKATPRARARGNTVHVPGAAAKNEGAVARAVSAFRSRTKGMSGKSKALAGAAALIAAGGTAAAVRHGSKPPYERLSEKPKKRAG